MTQPFRDPAEHKDHHDHDGLWAIFEAQSGRRYFGNIIRVKGTKGDASRELASKKDLTPDQIRTAIAEWSNFLMHLKPIVEFETMPARHPQTQQMTKIPMISPPGLTTEPILMAFAKPGGIYFYEEMGDQDKEQHREIVEMCAHLGDRVKEDATQPRIVHPSEGVPAAAVPPQLRHR